MRCPKCGDDDIDGPACSCGKRGRCVVWQVEGERPWVVMDRVTGGVVRSYGPGSKADAVKACRQFNGRSGIVPADTPASHATTCLRCGQRDDFRDCANGPARRPGTIQAAPHSEMTRDEVVHEARRLGDATHGDGWRRLLWRMAFFLEGREDD